MTSKPRETHNPGSGAVCDTCVPAPDGEGWQLKVATVTRFVLPHLEDLEAGARDVIVSAACAVFVEHGGAVVRGPEGAEGFAVFLDEVVDDGAVTAAMMACNEVATALRDEAGTAESRPLSGVLELRAGIATGSLVVDSQGAPTPGVEGMPADLAKRLAHAAGPDEVLIDEATLRAISIGVPVHSIDALRLGGVALPAWRLDVTALPPRVHTGRLLSQRSQKALIGRDRELATVHELFEAALGEARLHRVAVVGPQGSGRGRFIDEASRRVRAAWSDAATARATIQGRDELSVPFELRRALVTSLVGSIGEPHQPLSELLDTLSAFEPALADRFVQNQLDMLAETTAAEEGTPTDPEHASEATYAAVAALMRAAAKRGGLIVGLHGLSNAREDHQRQLIRLLEGLLDHPVVVLFATATDHTPSSEWSLDGAVDEHVALAPLSMQSGAHLLDQLLGRPDALDRATVQALVDRTGGLPLVLEETLAALGDMGQLHRDDESSSWSLDSSEALDGLPQELHDLFGWRLDRLSDVERGALRRAATVGPVFWRGLIEDLGTPRVAAVFRRLEDRGFIQKRARDTLDGEQAYGFTHPVLRPLLLAQCDDDETTETHARTARWLSTHAGDEDMRWMGAIAWHFSNAGQHEQSASYDVLAGRWARSVGDLGLATEHFERANRDAASRDEQMEALLAQGESLQLARRHAEAQPILDEALEWADEQGEPRLVLRCLLAQTRAADASFDVSAVEAYLERALPLAVTLEDDDARARLMLILARTQLAHGRHEAALETLGTALSLASDRLTATRLAIQRGRLFMHMGRLAEARETLDAAASDALALHHEVLFEIAREGKGWVALAQGEVEEGAALFADGARVFGRLGSHRPALRCALGLAHVQASRESYTAAANEAAAALEEATDRGEPIMEAWALSSIAWIFGEVRRDKHKLKAKELTAAALKVAKIDLAQHLERAMATLDEMGGGPGLYRGHAALARAEQLADQGDDEAHAALEVAEAAVQGFESGRLRIRLDQLSQRLSS